MSTLVYGTDPEFFAGYEKDGKVFVLPPAWFRKYGNVSYIPENERGHHTFCYDEVKGVKVIEDGVAFEETIKPSTDWRELFDRIQVGKKMVEDKVLSKFEGVCLPNLLSIPTINYEVERWKLEGKQDEDFELCFVFGCDRDYKVEDYDLDGNQINDQEPKVINALLHPFRYAGGHIHVSGSKAIKEKPIPAVYSLKFSAGLAYAAFSKTPDLDKQRTNLYGQPGKFRPQNYGKLFEGISYTDVGIEYRTPSTSWTADISIAEKLFHWVEVGIKSILETGLVYELVKTIDNEANDAIINCKQQQALQLLNYIEEKI